MAVATMIKTVVEEETGTEYPVLDKCRNCWRIEPEFDRPWIFNKNTGSMHLAGQDEFTLCGRKATEPQWLWQL